MQRRTVSPTLDLLRIGFAAKTGSLRSAHALKACISPCKKGKKAFLRYAFCCTFRSLTAPSLSLVSSPVESRLSSPRINLERLPFFPDNKIISMLLGETCVFYLWSALCLFDQLLQFVARRECGSSVRKRSAFPLYVPGSHLAPLTVCGIRCMFYFR